MDTSKEYIRMCEKAVEIQKLWEPFPGDFIKHSSMNGFHVVSWRHEDFTFTFGLEITLHEPKKDWIWLPRQDQLQGMVDKHLDTLSKLQGVWIFVNSFKLEPKSMEQLWLKFVMFKLYNKHYHDGEWRAG